MQADTHRRARTGCSGPAAGAEQARLVRVGRTLVGPEQLPRRTTDRRGRRSGAESGCALCAAVPSRGPAGAVYLERLATRRDSATR